jgi:hypothetical protein
VPKKSQRQIDPFHDALLLLDRLEELREDMEELGIRTIDELRQRIVELEALIHDEDDDGPV